MAFLKPLRDRDAVLLLSSSRSIYLEIIEQFRL